MNITENLIFVIFDRRVSFLVIFLYFFSVSGALCLIWVESLYFTCSEQVVKERNICIFYTFIIYPGKYPCLK